MSKSVPEIISASLSLALLLLLLGGCAPALNQTTEKQTLVAEPAGFRLTDYRAPVPQTLRGAKVLDSVAELKTLIASSNPVLIDVYPAAPKPASLGKDQLWIEPTRKTIPNSVWMANVGEGVVTEKLTQHLNKTLSELSGGDFSRAMVFFCEPNCWHSWNAAKRAVVLGYQNVYWYRVGVEFWLAENNPLERVTPLRPEG